MYYLNEAEHLREGLSLLWGELEAHLGVLLFTQRGAKEVFLHERHHLLVPPAKEQERQEQRAKMHSCTRRSTVVHTVLVWQNRHPPSTICTPYRPANSITPEQNPADKNSSCALRI